MTDQNEINILHVSTASSWRGGEQQLAYLFESLKEKAVKQHILCLDGSEMEARCKKLNWKHTTSPKALNFDPRFAKRLRSICDQLKIDLVHTHDSHAHSFALMATRLFGNDAPIIVSRRVDFPIKSKGKYNHKSVARIVCVSDAIKGITGKDIGDQTKLVTVHSGIDTKRFEGKASTDILRNEFNIPKDTHLIGNVSALAPHKDYFTFLDTVKALEKTPLQAKFLIIGSGNLEAELKRYAERIGIRDRVIFTGFRNDIPSILPELDLFLITSDTEGLGTSILDALACKVPVVATAAGGIPEIIIDGKTGMLAPIKDPNALAQKVVEVLTDPALRKNIIEGASAHLLNFTKETTAEKTLDVYQEVMKRN